MSYIDNFLSSSLSLKNKEALTNHAGGGIEESGSSFGQHYRNCFLSPLNMEFFCISCYNWVICFSLCHANPMSPHRPSVHPKSAPVIITLSFGLYLS
jgi:hypothetical protein